MLSKLIVNALYDIVDFSRRTAGKGLHDPRDLFNVLDRSKDNKRVEKRKNWNLEQILQDNISYNQLPSSIKQRLDETVSSLKNDGFELHFDSSVKVINEKRINTDTGEEIAKESDIKDPELKYIWIKGVLNSDPIDLVITRYTANSNYRTYYKNKFYGDTTSKDKLVELFSSMVKEKVSPQESSDRLGKILASNKNAIDRELHHAFRNFEPPVKWNLVIVKPTKVDPTYRIGVILSHPNPNLKLEKKDLMTILNNIEPVREDAQKKVEEILKADKIDMEQIKVTSKTFDNFDKSPGFFVTVASKKLSHEFPIKESNINTKDIVQQYLELKR